MDIATKDNECSGKMKHADRREFFALCLMVLVMVSIFFWKAFLGYVAFPADQLYERWYPWKAVYEESVKSFHPSMRDPAHLSFPLQRYTVERFQAGEVPLWNPYILTGVPHLASSQEGAFYPSTFLYLILPFGLARNLDLAFHQALAAVTMGIFVVRLGGSVVGGIIAGLAFAWSGIFIAWLQYSFIIHAIAWLPLSWLLLHQIVLVFQMRRVLWFSVVISLQLLSGYAEFIFYNGLGVAIYLLARLLLVHGWRLRLKSAAVLGLACILGAGLAAPQLLPILELFSLSNRPSTSYAELAATGMPLYGMATAIAPFLLGAPPYRNYVGGVPYAGTQLYIGLLPLLFILLNAKILWGKPEARPLFAVGFVSLGLAMGTPILGLFLWLVPPFQSLRFIHRTVSLYTPAMCALAGLGFTVAMSDASRFLNPQSTRHPTIFRRLWLGIGASILALGAGFIFQDKLVEVGLGFLSIYRGFGLRRAESMELARSLSSLILWQLVGAVGLVAGIILLFHVRNRGMIAHGTVSFGVALLVAAEVLSYGLLYNPMVDLIKYPPLPDFPSISELRRDSNLFRVAGLVKKDPVLPIDQERSPPFPANMLVGYGIQDISGYLSLLPRRPVEFLSQIASARSDMFVRNFIWLSGLSDRPAARLLNLKYVLTNPNERPPFPGAGGPRYAGEVNLYETAAFLPRAFFVPEARVIQDSSRILDELARYSFRPDREVILEEEPVRPPGAQDCDHSESAATAEVELTRYAPEDVVARVTTPRSGYLFLADAYYPGWQAVVKGVEVPIYRANYTFRAVPVGCGVQEVRFEYRPLSFRVGLLISLVTAMGCAGGLFVCGRRSAEQRRVDSQ